MSCGAPPQSEIRRPIQYLGSKLRLLDEIERAVDELDSSQGTVCDLFSGSGTVSAAMINSRNVISSDIQKYSQVLCDAMLLSGPVNADPEAIMDTAIKKRESLLRFSPLEDLLSYEAQATDKADGGEVGPLYEIIEQGSIYAARESAKGELEQLVTSVANILGESPRLLYETQVLRYFGGLYYSYDQALDLDCLLFAASQVGGAAGRKALASVLSAASDTVNTVGSQFAQPLKVRDAKGNLKTKLAPAIVAKRRSSVRDSFSEWISYYLGIPAPTNSYEFLCMDYAEALSELKKRDVSVVYADPPYTRYHYSRYYHVLETMCLRDMPSVSNTCRNGGHEFSRAMYRKDRHQSPFCIKSQAEGAFETLFKGVAELGVPLVLSYSPFRPSRAVTPRLQTIEQLVEKASIYFSSVETRSPGEFTHSKFNSTEKNFGTNREAELLILCK